MRRLRSITILSADTRRMVSSFQDGEPIRYLDTHLACEQQLVLQQRTKWW